MNPSAETDRDIDRGNGPQRRFGVDKRAYLTEEQADYLCKDIEELHLLRSLADLCDGHTRGGLTSSANDGFLSEPAKSLFLPALRWLSSEGYDFGSAYYIAATVFVKVLLKPEQPVSNPSKFLTAVLEAVEKRQKERDQFHVHRDDSGQEIVRLPYEALPRRIWDIKSNRVIPFSLLTIKIIEQDLLSEEWVVEFFESGTHIPEFWAISHSWTNDIKSVATMSNRQEWPVPLPAQVSLNQVRRELDLRFGCRHVWLDVLCLRQDAGPDFEEVKKQEWKLDVPTIGNIYRIAKTIIRYFNGLGRKFSAENWDDSRHWLQRAWTLQELRSEDITYNGGVRNSTNLWNTVGIFEDQKRTLRQAMAPIWELARHIEQEEGHGEIYRLVKEMHRRHASNPLDKLAGLFYLLRTTSLPVYMKDSSPGEAWEACLHVLSNQTQLELFFDFPYQGIGGRWFPSWEQLFQWPDRDVALEHLTREVKLDVQFGTYPTCHCSDKRTNMLFIKNLTILPNATLQHTNIPGEYLIKTSKIGNARAHTRMVTRKQISFQSVYLEQKPIPQGLYVLVTPQPSASHNWVVCEPFWEWMGCPRKLCRGECIGTLHGHTFKKVGVLRTDAVIWLTGSDSTLEKRSCLFV